LFQGAEKGDRKSVVSLVLQNTQSKMTAHFTDVAYSTKSIKVAYILSLQVRGRRCCVAIRTAGSTTGSTWATYTVSTHCPSCVHVPRCPRVGHSRSIHPSNIAFKVRLSSTLVRSSSAVSFRAGSTLRPPATSSDGVYAGNRKLSLPFAGREILLACLEYW